MGSAQPGSFHAGLECHCGSSFGIVELRDVMVGGGASALGFDFGIRESISLVLCAFQ
jgi:hypothetical protein